MKAININEEASQMDNDTTYSDKDPSIVTIEGQPVAVFIPLKSKRDMNITIDLGDESAVVSLHFERPTSQRKGKPISEIGRVLGIRPDVSIVNSSGKYIAIGE